MNNEEKKIICMIFGVSGVGKSTLSKEVQVKFDRIGKRCRIIEYRDVLAYINKYLKKTETALIQIPTIVGEKKFREFYFAFLKQEITSFLTYYNANILLIPVQASGLFNNEWHFIINKEIINFLEGLDNLYLVYVDSIPEDILIFRQKKLSKWRISMPSDNYLNPYIIELEKITELSAITLLAILTSKSFFYIFNSIKKEINKTSKDLFNFLNQEKEEESKW